MERSNLWPWTKANMTRGRDLFKGAIERGTQSRYDLYALEPLRYAPAHCFRGRRLFSRSLN